MQVLTNQFLEERIHIRRFFNRMSPLCSIVERHLFPVYRRVFGTIALSPEFHVPNLAMGTGLWASVLSECGHAVSGLNYTDDIVLTMATA